MEGREEVEGVVRDGGSVAPTDWPLFCLALAIVHSLQHPISTLVLYSIVGGPRGRPSTWFGQYRRSPRRSLRSDGLDRASWRWYRWCVWSRIGRSRREGGMSSCRRVGELSCSRQQRPSSRSPLAVPPQRPLEYLSLLVAPRTRAATCCQARQPRSSSCCTPCTRPSPVRVLRLL